MKDINTIRRALTEADPSDRLIAVHSLEMMQSRDAIVILEEFYPNSVNFEKFFVHRAIQNIKIQLETGKVSKEVMRSLQKQRELLRIAEEIAEGPKGVVASSAKEWDGEFDSEEVMASLPKLKPKPSEAVENKHSVLKKEPVLEVAPVTTATDDLQDMGADLENADAYSAYAGDEYSDPFATMASDGSVPEYGYDAYDDLMLAPASTTDQAEEYDDLLPPPAAGSMDEYEDLLPPMVNAKDSDSYDDLLPPLQGGDVDDYEELLPPMLGTSGDSGSPDVYSSQDEYESLLPPVSEVALDDYEDLLPPTRRTPTKETRASDDYEDLLPPLKSEDDEDYDDLLPPLKKG